MNPLHIHDIIDDLIEAIPRPLNVEGHCFGSDPRTHKQMREEQNNEISEKTASHQSASTASSSSTDTETKSSDPPQQHSESSIKQKH